MDLNDFLIATVLRELRARNMTRSELGRRAHVHPKHVSRLLTGANPGSIHIWSHLLRTLDVSLDPSSMTVVKV